MSRLFYLTLLLLIVGCSSIHPISSKSNAPKTKVVNQYAPAQVDLNLPENISLDTGESLLIVPNEETVRLGERGGDVYTPENEVQASPENPSKKIRIGLSLGPGLYRTINYVSLLKSLEKQNIATHVVTGAEFGAIVASMYAIGMTPEVIEWNFYRYFKEKGNSRPFESDWLDDVDSLLLEKFKNKRIEDTKIKLYLTLYDVKTKKTYFFNKGNIRDLLLLNLKLSKSELFKRNNTRYSTAFESEVFNPSLMKRIGAEFVIGADVLGSKFDFEESNEFLVGVYGRAAGLVAKEKKRFDYFYSIPLAKMYLDSTENGAAYLLKSKEYTDSTSDNLKKVLAQKLSSKTGSPD